MTNDAEPDHNTLALISAVWSMLDDDRDESDVFDIVHQAIASWSMEEES